MIAQLNNSNNNKCRHRRSEQNIHRSSSFPIKMGMPLQLVLLVESGRYVLPNPRTMS
jgi:hypothetical protein